MTAKSKEIEENTNWLACKDGPNTSTDVLVGDTTNDADYNEFEKLSEEEVQSLEPPQPALAPPDFKRELLTKLVTEFTTTDIEKDPNLSGFMALHEQLRNIGLSLNEIPPYNWELLSTVFEYIYGTYVDEMREINREFEALDTKRAIWMESAHRMDGQRGEERIKKTEAWISDTEHHLQHMQRELVSSVKVIKHTLNKFDH